MIEEIASRLLSALPKHSSSSVSNEAEDSQSNYPLISRCQFDIGSFELLKEWSDDLEKELLRTSSRPHFRVEEASVSSSILKDAACSLHESLLFHVIPSKLCNIEWSTDEAAEEASWKVVNSLFDSLSASEYTQKYWTVLAEILRAAGLFLRWYDQDVRSTISLSDSNSSDNPTMRLKSRGMLVLCARLMNIDTPIRNSLDIPRFASIYLFRSMYGNDELAITAREFFVDSMDGCTLLIKAFMKGDQPVSRLFSITRNVHNLISSVPASIIKMDAAVHSLSTDIFPNGEIKYGLLEVLVSTLVWAVRSHPTFPGDGYDRRSDLALEILRTLFALNAGLSSNTCHSFDTMTQIGFILCDLLLLSNADGRVYQCKLAVVALLLNAPKEYNEYLLTNGAIPPLLDIMKYQLSVVVIERTSSGVEDAAAVVPILLVLRNLTQSNKAILKLVKDEVFPLTVENEWSEIKVTEWTENKEHENISATKMSPLDCPRGTLRWKLIRLMTWTESNVKRSATELLWTLCEEDSAQFVERTGLGNAIHFLGLKGLVNLPTGVEQ